MRGFTAHMNLAFLCMEYNPSHYGNLEPVATTGTQNIYPAVGGPWRRPLAMVSPRCGREEKTRLTLPYSRARSRRSPGAYPTGLVFRLPCVWQAQHRGLSPHRGWQGKHFSHYPAAVNWGSAKDAEPTSLWRGWGGQEWAVGAA